MYRDAVQTLVLAFVISRIDNYNSVLHERYKCHGLSYPTFKHSPVLDSYMYTLGACTKMPEHT